MRVDVDEARRDCKPARVDLLLPCRCKLRGDCRDQRATYRDVHDLPFLAAPIEHGPAANHQLMVCAPQKESRRTGDCDESAGSRRDETSSIDLQLDLAARGLLREPKIYRRGSAAAEITISLINAAIKAGDS